MIETLFALSLPLWAALMVMALVAFVLPPRIGWVMLLGLVLGIAVVITWMKYSAAWGRAFDLADNSSRPVPPSIDREVHLKWFLFVVAYVALLATGLFKIILTRGKHSPEQVPAPLQ